MLQKIAVTAVTLSDALHRDVFLQQSELWNSLLQDIMLTEGENGFRKALCILVEARFIRNYKMELSGCSLWLRKSITPA